jgi:X-Pro dipeptidyl-peptidase
MPSRRHALAAAAALAALVLPASAGAQTPAPWLKLQDGETQPQFALANAIEQTVYVETPLDTDRDGRRDRVRIRISRPGETESQGIDVAVEFEHSPYRGDCGNPPNHPVDVDDLPQAGEHKRASAALVRPVARARAKADLPGSLDDYYVPRGYAVVLGESIGTFGSDGCPDVGGPAETLGTYRDEADWPAPGTRTAKLALHGREQSSSTAGGSSTPTTS